jgi:hypothetical protein
MVFHHRAILGVVKTASSDDGHEPVGRIAGYSSTVILLMDSQPERSEGLCVLAGETRG